MRLYVSTRSSSLAARMALALSGLHAEVVEIGLRAGEHLTPAFAAINPKRQVPVLVLEDGTVITETPAILLAIGEMAPGSGLLPPAAPARWQVMEWLAWAGFTLPDAFRPAFQPGRFGPAAAEEEIRQAGLRRVEAALALMAERLGDRPWFVGEDVTLADCHLAMLTVFGGFLAVAPPDVLLAHRARLFALPAL
ncbi:MAG: glutathione S-transferase family protein, partial [Rubritepida sp.]|nr:glutathione S-transferase family protein [Rubritepida sp.]